MPLLALLASRLGLALAAVAAAVAALGAFYWWASDNGAARVEAQQGRQIIQQAEERARAEDDVARLRGDHRDELQRRWGRD